MKVFTAQQMRDFDRAATEEYGIPSIVLMENAALRVVEFLEAKFAPLCNKKIVILCGKGNNGGDGLAIARLLAALGCLVDVVSLTSPDELKGDPLTNWQPLRKAEFAELGDASLGHAMLYTDLSGNLGKAELFTEGGYDIALDAIFGTGFQGEARTGFVEMMKIMTCARDWVAVDILSGLNSDTGEIIKEAYPVDFTITFAAPKRGFFLRDGFSYSNEIWVGEIGNLPQQMTKIQTGAQTLDLETAKRLLPKRSLDAHKGDAGRVLIIGGSFGMSGAVALASRAALNAGCGLCIAAVPEKVLPIFAASILEATSHPLPCNESGKLLERAAEMLPELWKGVQVVAIGPGIGRSDETQALVRRIVKECPVPLIIDADALHALPAVADEVKNREADTILTPHPGEMGVLMGISVSEVNDARFESVEACAKKYGAVVVLKGARTLVATPDGQIFVNLTGNPGMATGGSGDVLTGTIAGLLAQLKNSENATKLGVYLHGFAGDLAFEDKGNGLVAGDIAAHLGRALVEIPQREVERINGRLRRLM